MTDSNGSIGRLHVIVSPDPAVAGWIERALELTTAVSAAGCPVVQSRIKGVDDRTRLAADRAIVNAAQAEGATAIVNDRADLAVAAGADGVHGGDRDLPPARMREIVGPDRVVGATARDPEAAQAVESAGADYVGVGPIYSTATKSGLPEPLGTDALAEIVAAVSIPVIAVAGITLDRVRDVRATGAHGIAVVGAVADAADPSTAVREFMRVLEVGA